MCVRRAVRGTVVATEECPCCRETECKGTRIQKASRYERCNAASRDAGARAPLYGTVVFTLWRRRLLRYVFNTPKTATTLTSIGSVTRW